MIISISGIDGAGKSTQISKLLGYCEEKKLSYCRKWSKARGTPGILLLKQIVRRDKGMADTEKLEYRDKVYRSGWKRTLLLYASLIDLCWYWGIYFRVLSKKYDVLILDRYIWDTYVEVSSEFHIENLSSRMIWKLVRLVAVKPQKSILLQITAEESLHRDLLKGEITTDELSVKKEKLRLYESLRVQNAWDTEIDAMQCVDGTFRQIIAELGI